jgi:hypothetical protein
VEVAAVGFLGVIVGALIGWFAGLAVARRSRDYAIELWQLDRDAHEADLRKALGAEMCGNLALLQRATAQDRRHHAELQTSAWTAAIGMRFKQDQSREAVQTAYVAGAQYNAAVRLIPPKGTGGVHAEASNAALELARAAVDAFTDGERLYGANGEDPGQPNRFAERAAERAAAAARERTLRRRLERAVAAFVDRKL